ncbi:MAG: hypothetical protein H7Z74_09630, partial [Anaerolineae bacterium]|nr:hypothetical protein [Gemmatimonadaceae bacterium]
MNITYRTVVLALSFAGVNAFSARAQSAAPATDTLRFTFLSAGRSSGEMKTWASADGEWHAFFEFNDRGRGPRLQTRMRLGADGIPTYVETTGHDYLKNTVSETYRVSGSSGAWKNSAESGSAPAAGAFYLSFDGSPAESAVFARALLKSTGGKLQLL